MHELSIVEALVEQIGRHLPPKAILRSAVVQAGAMRALDECAMQTAWQVLGHPAFGNQAQLQLKLLRWTLHCPACDKDFEADEPHAPCNCGQVGQSPQASDELRLLSLQVDDA